MSFKRFFPNQMRGTVIRFSLAVLVGVQSSANATEPADSVEFFEKRIRPVLVEHCFECHSSQAEEIGGSLWLDSSDGMREGGDSGPAIEPGDVDSSLLISAIRYESSEMPPSGKLPEQTIADFEAWVAAGAIDPRKRTTVPISSKGSLPASGIDIAQGRRFWAFQPLKSTSSPIIQGANAQSSIDDYIFDGLHQAGITPNGPAEPGVRLRRLTFDLIGLPPSVELQERWLADPSRQNWIRIVDELLASPQYGEHWGRHWLDVVRYADSNGSDFNATFHDAWRYRDYVIDSLNRDRPFDEFVTQQIAGDLLPAQDDAQRYDQIVATTFLMVGTKMLSERDKLKLEMDVVDEQIDTVGRVFMGMTLGCVRCHDHKFDPIPMTDYYALAGIFRSTRSLQGESQQYVSTWPKTPLPVSDFERQRFQEYEAKLKRIKGRLKKAESSLKTAREAVKSNLGGVIVDDVDATKVGKWVDSTFFKDYIGKGYIHDENSNRGQTSITYKTRLPVDGTYEVRLSHSPGSTRSSRVAVSIQTSKGNVDVLLDQRKNNQPPMWSSVGSFDFLASEDAIVTISNRDSDGHVIADAVQFLSPSLQTIQRDSPSEDLVTRFTADVDSLKAELKQLEAAAPPPLPTAMAVADKSSDKVSDSPVCIRGEPKNHGPIVPRGFLQVCSSGNATIQSPQGSGRLELARWLTDPDHPLVSRVIVNRIWMHLMGEGIVRTVDNFGFNGERPSHPELLDAMAIQFIRGGWQIKPLVREIVCSDAYARSSQHSADNVAMDAENRWWWRMHRRRIEAESVRDAMLVAADELDVRPISQPMKDFGVLVSGNDANDSANVGAKADSHRSVYSGVIRGYIPPLMTMLDAADPDLIVGRRNNTNVPSQSLVLVNSPEVRRWAEATARRVTQLNMAFDERLRWLYVNVLQRELTDADIRLAVEFGLDSSHSDALWPEYIGAIMASTEFRLLD